MSKKIARVGDMVRYQCVRGDKLITGVGRISGGSSKSRDEGKSIARHNDTVNCGPCGTGYIQATAKNRADGKPIARVQDNVRVSAGSGVIITASSKTSSD